MVVRWEAIDKKISTLLDDNSYAEVLKALKNRLVVISQITLLKEKFGGIPEGLRSRFESVFSNAGSIQVKIKEKQTKLSARLDKFKKNSNINRGRMYRSR